MTDLSLYSVQAILILDGSGNRVYANYYRPPHEPEEQLSTLSQSVKKQKEFEKQLFNKTHKQDSEILIFEDHLVLYKEYLDVTLYLIGSIEENEMVLQLAFSAFKDSLDLILNSGIDKKNIQEHYDMVLLAIDETIDHGVILETDPAAIASRVTKPPVNEPQITLDLDKGLLGAWGFAKSRLQERLQQGI
ncbi:probable Coatomer subunit zeta [Zygosaccharomyces bailii]|uniref:Coatomer subunit zeta n=1 Tax=Zygosaccharomyces bailii (strain CLIB 213 / ATCC 58445 / CBS 680 / BCRC 21525 / NBRC 1098 / NCYC 1416 / NRRL Y-2227) TaxID=1333698 RepID=A0A8J2XA30_ZYGB2|nr:ZYBA0S09-00650g1_1 [Zygosaccharomyces bailii CLIB 213]CDH13944.1 probable Coatomer subunit zeta [Zygosaccharomyces bailii ISA1307]SJM85999.1 probable Coatomer subunit zeta [Zygosaccharomyces bailii]